MYSYNLKTPAIIQLLLFWAGLCLSSPVQQSTRQEEIICEQGDPSTWGKLYANPDDLTTFYACTPDGLQLIDCPEGLIFPIGGSQCDWPDSSSPRPSSVTTTRSPTTTPEITTPEPTTTEAPVTTTRRPTTTTERTTPEPTTTEAPVTTTRRPTTTTERTTPEPTTTEAPVTTTRMPTTTTERTTPEPTTTEDITTEASVTTTRRPTTTPEITTPEPTTTETTEPTTAEYQCPHILIPGKVGTWNEALSECESRGLELTTVNSNEEFQCILNLIKGENQTMNYWTSGNDLEKEGRFVWETTGVPFTMFYPEGNGQPDNGGGIEDCVALRKYYFEDDILPFHQMNDEYCPNRFAIICK